MKYVKGFNDFVVSEGFRYHMENGLDITNSVYRLGSEAYKSLFEETKKYWDEGNVILKDKAAWMAANLEVGKPAIYDGRRVELDTPFRGGDKKFIVYRFSGRNPDKTVTIVTVKKEDEMVKGNDIVKKIAAKAEF